MELAREALKMFLNGKVEAAEDLFRHHSVDNYHMKIAHCFSIVMNAVMSSEQGEMERAAAWLKTTENQLAPDTGLAAQIKHKLSGRNSIPEVDVVELLETQIMLADCQVCSATLFFLQQEIGTFIKGAVGLRRAWKTYERIYNSLRSNQGSATGLPPQLHGCGSSGGDSEMSPQMPPPHMASSVSTPCLSVAAGTHSLAAPPLTTTGGASLAARLRRSTSRGKLAASDLPHCLSGDTVQRLLASVSFGYGLFQLVVSLLPGHVVKVAQLLGFDSERSTALSALQLCHNSADLRAPLASLCLLTYHTITRPLLSLDGNCVDAGAAQAQLVLEQMTSVSASAGTGPPQYSQSPLVLFFTGRLRRLQRDMTGCIDVLQRAMQSTSQREVQLLCLHEIGWCYLVQLKWREAFDAFSTLAGKTRWNRTFYQYIAAVTSGADGQLSLAQSLLAGVSRAGHTPCSVNTAATSCSTSSSASADAGESSASSSKSRGSAEVDAFISGRATNGATTQHHCRLLVYELLYLWHALPCCQAVVWQQILADCAPLIEQSIGNGGFYTALACLVSGGVCDNTDLSAAERFYRRARQLADTWRETAPRGTAGRYVAPFACYELAEILCGRAERRTEGRALLQAARDNYKQYEFQSRLSVRIQAALRRLDKETAK